MIQDDQDDKFMAKQQFDEIRRLGREQAKRLEDDFKRAEDRKKRAKSCRTCAFYVGAGCLSIQLHPYDSGPDQPYCDGYVEVTDDAS